MVRGASGRHRLLRAILNTAVEDQLLVTNPCTIKGAGVEPCEERVIPSVTELYALADAVSPRYRALVLLAAFGGLRRGELFGLTRGDVNLLHRTVSVRVQRQESRRGEILLGPPKTAAGRRTLVLPAELLPELRPHLRDELPPDDAVVVVRGGPTTIERLAVHVDRTHDAFSLDGQPLWGVSVFCALDETGSGSVDGLLERFSSYRVVHLPRVGQIRAARFELLPSFGRPHYTLRLMTADGPELARLIAALGPAEANPYHGGKRPGRR